MMGISTVKEKLMLSIVPLDTHGGIVYTLIINLEFLKNIIFV